MIKTLEQARNVQERRAKAGKLGVAKAVHRFLLRTHSYDYQKFRNALPVSSYWNHT